MFSSAFVTRVDFSLLLALLLRYQYSSQLETGQFAGRSADYAWMLILGLLVLTMANAWLGMASLWEALSMLIVYVWSQYNRAVTVSFWLGLRFPAVYLPLVLTAMEFITGGSVWGSVLGIVTGHLYYFVAEIYPNPRLKAYLRAPALLARLIGGQIPMGQTRSFSGFTMHAPRHQQPEEQPAGFAAFSGKGRKIGG